MTLTRVYIKIARHLCCNQNFDVIFRAFIMVKTGLPLVGTDQCSVQAVLFATVVLSSRYSGKISDVSDACDFSVACDISGACDYIDAGDYSDAGDISDACDARIAHEFSVAHGFSVACDVSDACDAGDFIDACDTSVAHDFSGACSSSFNVTKQM